MASVRLLQEEAEKEAEARAKAERESADVAQALDAEEVAQQAAQRLLEQQQREREQRESALKMEAELRAAREAIELAASREHAAAQAVEQADTAERLRSRERRSTARRTRAAGPQLPSRPLAGTCGASAVLNDHQLKVFTVGRPPADGPQGPREEYDRWWRSMTNGKQGGVPEAMQLAVGNLSIALLMNGGKHTLETFPLTTLRSWGHKGSGQSLHIKLVSPSESPLDSATPGTLWFSTPEAVMICEVMELQAQEMAKIVRPQGTTARWQKSVFEITVFTSGKTGGDSAKQVQSAWIQLTGDKGPPQDLPPQCAACGLHMYSEGVTKVEMALTTPAGEESRQLFGRACVVCRRCPSYAPLRHIHTPTTYLTWTGPFILYTSYVLYTPLHDIVTFAIYMHGTYYDVSYREECVHNVTGNACGRTPSL